MPDIHALGSSETAEGAINLQRLPSDFLIVSNLKSTSAQPPIASTCASIFRVSSH